MVIHHSGPAHRHLLRMGVLVVQSITRLLHTKIPCSIVALSPYTFELAPKKNFRLFLVNTYSTELRRCCVDAMNPPPMSRMVGPNSGRVNQDPYAMDSRDLRRTATLPAHIALDEAYDDTRRSLIQEGSDDLYPRPRTSRTISATMMSPVTGDIEARVRR